MVRPGADDDCAFIAGDGDYAIEVVSESRHQERLEWLGQGRGEEPVDYDCTAVLAHEPDNPHVADAVSVSINGVRVGYLPPDAAASMIAAMQTWGFDRATCDAIIEGGWYRSADDKGDFCVRLDVNPEFLPATLPVEHPPLPPAPIAAATRPRNTVYDLVIGATATVAMLVLVGVVWLFVQQSTRSVTTERYASASAAHESAPAERRAAEVASAGARDLHGVATRPNDGRLEEVDAVNARPSARQRDVKVVTAGSEQASPVPTSSAEGRPDLRVAAAEPVGDVPTATPPQRTRGLLPTTRGVSSDASAHAPSVDMASVHHVPTPAGVSVARRASAVAVASSAAEETRAPLDHEPLIARAVRAAVEELDPSATTATSPPGLSAVAPGIAVHSSLPPKQARGTEWVRVIPPPRPEADPAGSADTADAKANAEAEATAKVQAQARADRRRSRARAPSRAAARTARTRTRARNGARNGRNGRRAVQYRRAAARAAARSPAPAPALRSPVVARAASPPVPPATRLFEAWTNDVKAAMEQHKRTWQPR